MTSTTWSAKHQSGAHTVRIVVDPDNNIAESDEHNNAAATSFAVQGNKIRNASFEQSASGAAPDGWTPSGPTSYSSGGSDGSRSASTTPGGTWTSDAVTVTPGAAYDVSVRASGAGGTLIVQQLAPNGTVISSSLPLASGLGFTPAEFAVTPLPTTVQLRVVLVGGLAGTTSFDDVQVVGP